MKMLMIKKFFDRSCFVGQDDATGCMSYLQHKFFSRLILRKIYAILIISCSIVIPSALPFYMDKPTKTDQNKQQQFDVYQCFYAMSPDWRMSVVTDPEKLLHAAQDALRFLYASQTFSGQLLHAQSMEDLVSQVQVEQTLRFLIDIIKQDLEDGNFRILDPEFLKQNFSCLRWIADKGMAEKHKKRWGADGKIRLTKYAVFEFSASSKKTAEHPYALYALRDESIKGVYSKEEILAGALDHHDNKEKVKPLVWLSLQGLEEALMQGSVLVSMPSGKKRMFNVDCSNGVEASKVAGDTRKKKRYCFFREVNSGMFKKYQQRSDVVFAGDTTHLGIGKLIAITGKHPKTGQEVLRLGIVGDTGGAFANNLYQLDLYVGVFANRKLFRDYISNFPEFVDAYLLYRLA